jgi:hypothetical protein
VDDGIDNVCRRAMADYHLGNKTPHLSRVRIVNTEIHQGQKDIIIKYFIEILHRIVYGIAKNK